MKTIRCPECRGSGVFETDPSGAFHLDCPVCDGEGEIDVPTCQEDLDEPGIPADAADLIDVDEIDS